LAAGRGGISPTIGFDDPPTYSISVKEQKDMAGPRDLGQMLLKLKEMGYKAYK
jgi:hypothetical protein